MNNDNIEMIFKEVAGVWRRVDSQEPHPQTLAETLKTIYMEKYTIIFSIHTEGQIVEVLEKEQVRSECEKLKKLTKLEDENTYARIEIVNNETGEIREYWNNHENKINF